jgi:A/G-specific adenine glycosylase
VVVDANVERVVARLFAIATPLPAARPAIRAHAEAIFPGARAGDFAQALMDLGSTICTTRAPRCLLCPVRAHCAAFAGGAPDHFPVKPVKTPRPTRYGTIFWLERDAHVLLVRRPPRGLLGGMRALPTGPWGDLPPGLDDAPAAVDWQVEAGGIAHVFTHFRLECRLARGVAGAQTAHEAGEWWPIARLGEAGLPSLFAKAAEMFGRVRCA